MTRWDEVRLFLTCKELDSLQAASILIDGLTSVFDYDAKAAKVAVQRLLTERRVTPSNAEIIILAAGNGFSQGRAAQLVGKCRQTARNAIQQHGKANLSPMLAGEESEHAERLLKSLDFIGRIIKWQYQKEI